QVAWLELCNGPGSTRCAPRVPFHSVALSTFTRPFQRWVYTSDPAAVRSLAPTALLDRSELRNFHFILDRQRVSTSVYRYTVHVLGGQSPASGPTAITSVLVHALTDEGTDVILSSPRMEQNGSNPSDILRNFNAGWNLVLPKVDLGLARSILGVIPYV